MIMKYISIYLIPGLILFVITYGILKGVKVYECFVEGAKEGLNVCKRIFPYLLAMLFAVTIIRESKLLPAFIQLMEPVTAIFGIPSEILPLILIKPLSGSGALGVFTEIINTYGADGFIGICASIVMGSTETIFYTISIYYGSVEIKKIRHTLWAALIADFTAVIAAVTLTRIFIGK